MPVFSSAPTETMPPPRVAPKSKYHNGNGGNNHIYAQPVYSNNQSFYYQPNSNYSNATPQKSSYVQNPGHMMTRNSARRMMQNAPVSNSGNYLPSLNHDGVVGQHVYGHSSKLNAGPKAPETSSGTSPAAGLLNFAAKIASNFGLTTGKSAEKETSRRPWKR
jgi:hypothetical protein